MKEYVKVWIVRICIVVPLGIVGGAVNYGAWRYAADYKREVDDELRRREEVRKKKEADRIREQIIKMLPAIVRKSKDN